MKHPTFSDAIAEEKKRIETLESVIESADDALASLLLDEADHDSHQVSYWIHLKREAEAALAKSRWRVIDLMYIMNLSTNPNRFTAAIA